MSAACLNLISILMKFDSPRKAFFVRSTQMNALNMSNGHDNLMHLIKISTIKLFLFLKRFYLPLRF